MPEDQSQRNRRLVALDSAIAALAIMQQKRSEVVQYGAHRQAVAAALEQSAKHSSFAAQLEQAREDIKIVAVTGIAACFGSFVVTQLLARAHGVAFASLRLATPVVARTASVATPLGTTIEVTSTRAIGLGVTGFITAQILQTVLLRIPVSQFLRRYVGDSSLSRIFNLIKDAWNETEFSPEDFASYREGLIASSVGTDRNRAILRNRDARPQELRRAMKEMVSELVSRQIAEIFMSIDTPANALLLMNETERAEWYRRFEREVRAYIDDNHPDLSEDEKIILSTNLKYDFWVQVNNQLRALDQNWQGLIRDLQQQKRNIDLTMENLLGGNR